MKSTILIEKILIRDLKKAKDYPRQTYDDIIRKLLDVYTLFQGVQFDTAHINTLKKSKMTEIWESKEDETWDEI